MTTLKEAFQYQFDNGSPVTLEDVDIFMLQYTTHEWNELLYERARLTEHIDRDFRVHFWFEIEGTMEIYSLWSNEVTEPEFVSHYEVSPTKVEGSNLPVIRPKTR
jgi:hypothetical protein